MRKIDKEVLTQLKAHQQQLDGHQDQLNGHQDQLNGHQEQLNGHQEQLNGHQQQLNEYYTLLENMRSSILDVNPASDIVDVNIVQEQLNGHQDQLNGHQQQLTAHQKFMERLEQQLDRQRGLIESLRQNSPKDILIDTAMTPYGSVNVNNINYVYKSTDKEIPNSMLYTGINYSKDLIDEYIRIADQIFYSKKPSDTGLFLDIGGNIGTTTIYCKKFHKPKYKFIAFEPVRDNVRVLKANCCLNNMENDVICEEIALSSETRHGKIYVTEENMGHCNIDSTEQQELGNIQDIMTVTLDEYLKEKDIDITQIKYIWIDTEGHEFDVLQGAVHLMSVVKIPMCIEFNQDIYKKTGKYDKMYKLLCDNFTSFCEAGKIITDASNMRPIHDIINLWTEKEGNACDIILF